MLLARTLFQSHTECRCLLVGWEVICCVCEYGKACLHVECSIRKSQDGGIPACEGIGTQGKGGSRIQLTELLSGQACKCVTPGFFMVLQTKSCLISITHRPRKPKFWDRRVYGRQNVFSGDHRECSVKSVGDYDILKSNGKG